MHKEPREGASASVKIGAIIQARMTSLRFPGKILVDLLGKPLLGYVIERVQRARGISFTLVATSAEPEDDPVVEFCKKNHVEYHRGPLANVARRFLEVVDRFSLDAFVRVNGDSPLIDPELIGRGMHLFESGSYDMVTNVFPRSYPKGQSVEILKADAFRAAYTQMESPEDLEHVTRFFYRNSGSFAICNFSCDQDLSDVQLTVDNPADLETVASIVATMKKPHWEYSLTDIMRLYNEAH